VTDLKPDRQHQDLHKSNLPATSWKIGPVLIKWCQEAAVKISDFSDKRAKSYACFTEGISSYVFQKAQYGSDS
jgi:hypothetical protein